MRGKWLWLIYPVALLIIIRTALAAFSVPWRWTQDQVFFLFLIFCVVVGLGSWIVIWMRGGTAAVKARWTARQARMDAAFSSKAMSRNLLFWILVAVALVIEFNVSQH